MNNPNISGLTAHQMESAPHGSLYIWHSDDIRFPLALAKEVGRPDLVIIKRGAISPGYFANDGWPLYALIVDHEARLSPAEQEVIDNVRVRP
jgi:hypothetical protein